MNSATGWEGILLGVAGQMNIVGVLFTILVIFLIVMLVRRQLDEGHYKKFDLTDAILKNGRVSRDALFEWIGVLSLTYVLIHQEFQGKLQEWFIYAYVGAILVKGVTNIIKRSPTAPKDIGPNDWTGEKP